MNQATHTTKRGTPWATTWDKAWAKHVDTIESNLRRRICGAKTLAGSPCTLPSNHPTGRCKFHGGTDAIGAPIGNHNARVHGLYARRLQRCGTHCPMWEHCPFASPDVLALDPKERPNCAYESEEYDRAIEELTGGRVFLPGQPTPGTSTKSTEPSIQSILSIQSIDPGQSNEAIPSTIHNLALLQVMFSRAAAALSVTALTDTTNSEGERFRMQTTKVHAALEAFTKIAREHRAAHAQYRKDLEHQHQPQTNAKSTTSTTSTKSTPSTTSTKSTKQSIAPDDDLLTHPLTADTMKELISEGRQIMKEAGVHIPDADAAPTRPISMKRFQEVIAAGQEIFKAQGKEVSLASLGVGRLERLAEEQLGPNWRDDPDLQALSEHPAESEVDGPIPRRPG